MDTLDYGRMIWLSEVIDPQGERKGEHAAVIITTKEELAAGKPLIAVVISSQLRNAREQYITRLPHHPRRGGHPQTGFNRPSAAIGWWIVPVDITKISRYGNLVWGTLLHDVAACINKVKEDQRAGRFRSTQS